MTAVLDMVTLQKIGNSMNREILEITGLSTDDKPIDFINLTYITNGSTFEEIDTGTIYKYNEDAKEWVEQPSAGVSGGNISLDYVALTNKPQIGGKELTGNKTLDELGIQPKGTYLTKETDPTVPAWAKAETKPMYTADEVGALPKTTTSLPNPKKIKFTGAVTDEYDGSTEKTINIPKQSSYTLPQAKETALGGVKAKEKTSETVEVAIDTATGKLFVPAYPTGSGVELDKTLAVEGKAADAKAVGNELKKKQPIGNYLTSIPSEYITETELEEKGYALKTERVEKLASDTTAEIEPNKLYVFPEMKNLTITFVPPSDTKIVNEYHLIFKSGATATVFSIPESVNAPSGFSVSENTVYELSIMENCLTYQSWEVTV